MTVLVLGNAIGPTDFCKVFCGACGELCVKIDVI